MRYPAILSLLIVSMVGFAGTASADTSVYDWADGDMPVLIKNDSGLIFLTTEKKPQRVYTWQAQNDGEGFDEVYLVDLNGDQNVEVVGSGKPSFVLKNNGDPMWQIEDGCDQTVVADFIADDKLDVLCQDSRTLTAYTYDGQRAWRLSLGRSIDHCRVGDYNGDLKADMECKYRGMNQWARVDASGEVLAEELDEPELSEGGVDLDQTTPVSKDLLSGEEHIDLDGDGNADERLTADDGALVIGSKAKDEAIGRVELDGEAQAGLVKDLDGDGQKEIVVVTDDSIFVISHDGENTDKFSASAKSYDRKPHAELNSVYANGFSDADEKAQEVVGDLQDKLSQCYASRVRGSKFTGTGQLILQVNVDGDGNVSAVNKMHSEVNDKTVEQCAQKVLKGGDFPEAEEGAGTVNVNMKYTFRDE